MKITRMGYDFAFGRLPLWQAFWLFGIALNFLLTLVLLLLTHVAPASMRFAAVIGFAWWFFTAIGLWRCAPNTKYFLMGVLVRIWVVVGAIATLGHLRNEGVLWVDYVIGAALTLGAVWIIYRLLAPAVSYVLLRLQTRK